MHDPSSLLYHRTMEVSSKTASSGVSPSVPAGPAAGTTRALSRVRDKMRGDLRLAFDDARPTRYIPKPAPVAKLVPCLYGVRRTECSSQPEGEDSWQTM